MAEKNRFSKLLKHLMSVADIKNYTLAQELQYDVSYISKWTSGQMIPSEKNEKKILKGISECVVNGCGEEGRKKLQTDYQVGTCEELKLAILDHLEAEYFYVKEFQDSSGVEVAPKTIFFPELKLSQYISRMHHPVLRRVSGLDVVACMDIFSMEREYQFQIAEDKNKHVPTGKWYQDVHYSVLINIQLEQFNYVYDVFFLVSMLERNSCIDLRLYECTQAVGRSIFVVKDDYAMSGMLVGKDRCISVVVSEDVDICHTLYRNLMGLCNRDHLLFLRVTMRDMFEEHTYVHAMLALKQQWVIGHFTEHFLPENVFNEVLEEVSQHKDDGTLNILELKRTHQMTKRIIEESHIKILVYRTAFYDLVVDNNIDFYNYKIHLTKRQVAACMQYFLELCSNHPEMEIRMVSGRLISNIEYCTGQCIFLNDTISHLRLSGEYNNIFIISRLDIREAFKKTFELCWDNREKLITDRAEIIANIEHAMSGIIE